MESTSAFNLHQVNSLAEFSASNFGLLPYASPNPSDDSVPFWYVPPYYGLQESLAQGFKLHISATILNAEKIASIALKFLLQSKIDFKILRDLSALHAMNSGLYGFTQIGKFMTVYPASPGECAYIGNALYQELQSFVGPRVPSDFKVYTEGVVYLRYGAIKGWNRLGTEFINKISLPSGDLVEDSRDPRSPIPSWVIVPPEIEGLILEDKAKRGLQGDFQENDVKQALGGGLSDNSPLLLGRFIALKSLSLGSRGSTYKGLELTNFHEKDVAESNPEFRNVVLKFARSQAGIDGQGVDAVVRARFAFDFHCSLYKLFPELTCEPYELFERKEVTAISMEFVDSPTFEDFVSAELAPLSSEDAFCLSSNLVDAVEVLHSESFCLGDLGPKNVLVDQNLTVKFIDFENAFFDSKGFENKFFATPGFYDPRITFDDFPTKFAFYRHRDRFALSMLIFSVYCPNWYRTVKKASDLVKYIGEEVFEDFLHEPELIRAFSRTLHVDSDFQSFRDLLGQLRSGAVLNYNEPT